jgi:hypothetical protein
MSEKNLGITLSVVGVIIGLIGLFSSGFAAMIVFLTLYYFGVGIIITKLTKLSNNLSTWLFDLLKY